MAFYLKGFNPVCPVICNANEIEWTDCFQRFTSYKHVSPESVDKRATQQSDIFKNIIKQAFYCVKLYYHLYYRQAEWLVTIYFHLIKSSIVWMF